MFQSYEYQSDISINIFTGSSLVFYYEIRRLKDVQHNSLYKTKRRRITAKKYSSVLTIANTVVGRGLLQISHGFHVDIENEILCHEPGMSAIIFSISWNKSVSLMKISRNPSKYLPMTLLFIHREYVLL